jgi:hypothetical protein
VPEWSNGTVSKTVVRVTVPRVRIPPSPPILCFFSIGWLNFHLWRFFAQAYARADLQTVANLALLELFSLVVRTSELPPRGASAQCSFSGRGEFVGASGTGCPLASQVLLFQSRRGTLPVSSAAIGARLSPNPKCHCLVRKTLAQFCLVEQAHDEFRMGERLKPMPQGANRIRKSIVRCDAKSGKAFRNGWGDNLPRFWPDVL